MRPSNERELTSMVRLARARRSPQRERDMNSETSGPEFDLPGGSEVPMSFAAHGSRDRLAGILALNERQEKVEEMGGRESNMEIYTLPCRLHFTLITMISHDHSHLVRLPLRPAALASVPTKHTRAFMARKCVPRHMGCVSHSI